MREDVRFYCGLNETAWNGITPQPGPYTCIAPVCGRKEDATEADRRNTVLVPRDTLVLQDSGAFSDGPKHRLDYGAALERQIARNASNRVLRSKGRVAICSCGDCRAN